jgi:hypothetical protein
MGRTLLRGGDVLVGDPGDGIVETADLLIEEGRIAAIVDGAAPRAHRLAAESRERIVAAVEPRGGFLPPAPEGWFHATLDAFEANLAGAPKAGG